MDKNPRVTSKEYVFLDTSIFRKLCFNFDNPALQSVQKYSKLGFLKPLITDITINEVERLIKKDLTDAQDQMKEMKINSMRYFFIKNISIYKKEYLDDCYSSLQRWFQFYITQCSFEKVKIDTVKPSIVFKNFFSLLPPFSNSKPNEFRDAFVLQALFEYSDNKRVKINVISEDKDFMSFCAQHSKLVYFKSIDEFLNKISEENFDLNILQKLKYFIKDQKPLLIEKINDEIETWRFIADFDGEINDVTLDNISLRNLNIINIDQDEKNCIINVIISADFNINPTLSLGNHTSTPMLN